MKFRRLAVFWVVLAAGMINAGKVLAVGSFCDSAGNPSETPDLVNPKVYTALGCIPVEANGFITWLLPKVFGIAGGIAFLLMVSGFIQMATSKGDPKAVQAAKETIGSAITGLLVSIFALFILRLVVVDILHIPGISK